MGKSRDLFSRRLIGGTKRWFFYCFLPSAGVMLLTAVAAKTKPLTWILWLFVLLLLWVLTVKDEGAR